MKLKLLFVAVLTLSMTGCCGFAYRCGGGYHGGGGWHHGR